MLRNVARAVAGAGVVARAGVTRSLSTTKSSKKVLPTREEDYSPQNQNTANRNDLFRQQAIAKANDNLVNQNKKNQKKTTSTFPNLYKK